MAIIPKTISTVPGIYIIENVINNKKYIGSSTNMQKRIRKHKNTLINNTHPSSHLQAAWNKYGSHSFTAYEISCCLSINHLLDVEQLFLDQYQVCNKKYGYNIAPKANRSAIAESTKLKLRQINLGKRYSKETNQKKGNPGASNPFFGKKHSLETRLKMARHDPFVCIETGEVFNFCDDAAKKLNARRSSIPECLQGKRNMSNGFHFIYLKNTNKLNINGYVQLSDTEKADLIHKQDKLRKVFRCINTQEIFSSVGKAAKRLHVHRTGISNCLKRKIKQTHGLQFEYV